MIEPPFQIILVIVLLTAVVTDLKSYRIPNWLTVPAMACGLLLHAMLHGQSGLIMSLEGLGLGLGLFLVFYVMGGMGAGDVKLMAAIGSILGPEGVLATAVVTGLLGGVYAIVAMIAHWGLQKTVERIQTMLLTLSMPLERDSPKAQPQLRYALMIGLGTLLSQLVVVR